MEQRHSVIIVRRLALQHHTDRQAEHNTRHSSLFKLHRGNNLSCPAAPHRQTCSPTLANHLIWLRSNSSFAMWTLSSVPPLQHLTHRHAYHVHQVITGYHQASCCAEAPSDRNTSTLVSASMSMCNARRYASNSTQYWMRAVDGALQTNMQRLVWKHIAQEQVLTMMRDWRRSKVLSMGVCPSNWWLGSFSLVTASRRSVREVFCSTRLSFSSCMVAL